MKKMFPESFSYSEKILQAIWKEMWFDQTSLTTINGDSVAVIDPGVLNETDGPDFLNARISISGITFAGAVELHLKNKGWYAHGHHKDANYENVILHVVVEHGISDEVKTSSGDSVPTLNLLPALSGSLAGFLDAYACKSGLPCSGLKYISEEAFLAQIEKAHKEYLHQKIDDFYSFYDASLPPSDAWKFAFIRAIFDGFGISKNRDQMKLVAHKVISLYQQSSVISIHDGMSLVADLENEGSLIWNTKAVRANHHPRKRMPALLRLASKIIETPLDCFLFTENITHWTELIDKAELKGNHSKILYGTVFIPAMYALASLFSHSSLKKAVWEEWLALKSPIPKVLLSQYVGLPDRVEKEASKKLGAIYQLKKYCNTRRCSECEVLKKAFLS